MHQQFVEPSKRHADLIIPEGGQTHVGIDVLCGIIREKIRKEKNYYVLSIYMPLVEKEKFVLKKNNEDFIIEVGNFRKNVVLPRTLASLSPGDANFVNGYLEIKFS